VTLPLSEQWKQGGDCQLCRKREYCRKSCKQHELWTQRKIAEAFARTKAGRMMSAMKKTIHDLGGETEYLDG